MCVLAEVLCIQFTDGAGACGSRMVYPAGSAPTPEASVPTGPAKPTEGVPGIPVSSGAAATHGPASRPAAGAPKGTGPTATRTDPGPTATTTTPDTSPQERTLSSTGGSVVATCPSATTAQLLSWTATKPYKVDDV